MASKLAILTTVVAGLAALTATTDASAHGAAPGSSASAAAAVSATLLATAARGDIRDHAAGRSEQEALQGQYVLADGRVLSIAPRGRSLVADIGEGPAQRLHAVAPQVYQTPDGSLELSFTTAANGQVSGVRVAQRSAR
jgi:hypothetical protein